MIEELFESLIEELERRGCYAELIDNLMEGLMIGFHPKWQLQPVTEDDKRWAYGLNWRLRLSGGQVVVVDAEGEVRFSYALEEPGWVDRFLGSVSSEEIAREE